MGGVNDGSQMPRDSGRTSAERVKALLENEHRHLAILRTAMDGFWLLDIEGTLLEVNEAYCRMSGYSETELLGLQISDLDVGELPDLVFAHVGLVMQQGADRFVTRHRRKDGSTFAVEVSAQYQPADGGYLVAFVRDISARKQDETMLRLQGAALEAAANAIVITDHDGVIVWTNAAFTTFTGYSAQEAIGHRPSLIKSGKHDIAFYERLWRTITSGKVFRSEMINRRKDGTLYHEDMTITPLRDDSGAITHFIAVKLDITHEKAIEEQFRQAQKMESVGRLAGGVAHDYNNMLGVILGHAEMALQQLTPDQPLYADLAGIREAAVRSAALTRHLLTFARKQTVVPAFLNLNEVVAASSHMLERLLGANIHLACEPARGLWSVRMDPSQVEQLLVNLCVNSRDAISDVGSLMISTANTEIDDAYCAAHPNASPGDFVKLTVRDDGCGMSPEVLSSIFEPFFTTKAVGVGTGLGLSTVYGVVTQNGGFITVSSAVGLGTTFEIYLPRTPDELTGASADADTPAEHPAQRTSGASRMRETVLVVEDEPAILQLATRALLKHGYTVFGAAGAREAIPIAREHSGSINLLLTDLTMPEMNGRDLAAELQRIVPRLTCIFMSGYSSDAIFLDDAPGTPRHFIAKPFSISELTAKVRSVLDEVQGA